MICHPSSPCPCRMHTRIVLREGVKIQFADYRCVSEESPYDGLKCVQLVSQKDFCHDYTGQSLDKSVVVDVQYGCELRHDPYYLDDHSEPNHHHRHHHHHHHHNHHKSHQ